MSTDAAPGNIFEQIKEKVEEVVDDVKKEAADGGKIDALKDKVVGEFNEVKDKVIGDK